MKISDSVNRIDNKEKISGKAKYIDDINFPSLYYASTLRSSISHGKILNIKIPILPENYFIIDKNDIPGKNIVKIIKEDMPFLAEDEVNYIGEPILLIAGPDKEEVNKIKNAIEVSYKSLKADFEGKEIIEKYSFESGDIKKTFDESDEIFERTYKTGYQEQIYLETQGMIGNIENNQITVYGSMQCPYYVKNALDQLMNSDTRVIQTTTGGAFGGKEEFPSLIAGHAALAALKTKHPVKIVYDRAEDIICTTKRHPSKIIIKTSLKNKKITGIDVDISLNAGAYAGLSEVVLQRAMFAAIGVYNIKNLRVKGKALKTNTVPNGAFRGFGAPQAFFAIETHMNNIAMYLNKNPLDLKTEYLLKTSDSTSTGGIFRDEIKLPEMIKKITQESKYYKKYEEFKNKKNKGIGISLFFHGGGFTGSGERDIIKATVKLEKNKDKIEILVSNVEMGQGLQTTFRKIVAHALNKSYHEITFKNPDTLKVPDSGPTVASRSIMVVGKLLKDAADELKNNLDKEVITIEKHYKQPNYIKWDQEKMKGDAYPTYSWGIDIVEVEIDDITAEVEINNIWTINDVGIAIDNKIIKGQIEGGIVQGLGYSYLEVMNIKNGKILQNNLTNYIVPTSKDFPKIHSSLIENPYIEGPYGAKAAGELPLVGAAPAFVGAVQNALNKEFYEIPLTPEKIMEVMHNEN
ncbi:aldehyde oxidase [Tepiditoga spiralis]|uniref:Aldehyde oxidase n=1 Tax=Tepiditoga spiralis TaxID=2108365 RepID=A0A7G1G534_9BACT|nr:xanthine dehydrogenase family protein molybdopterin-binding subunit [Tepiditoga spiralis]BBE29997.1 aldehyde oxidase [Tepiditoga spiralis]